MANALVPSFRVHRNLHQSGATSERPTLKLREVQHTGMALGVTVVFERFLFVAFNDEVRYYDLDLDSGANIIIERR